MNRFLLLALTAGLLSPIAAKAERDEVRHICATMKVGEMSPKQGLKKLGLKVPRDSEEINNKAYNYCSAYLGSW